MPLLGICYGLQALVHSVGGVVEAAEHREFGRASLNIRRDDKLLAGIENGSQVWMSHGDLPTHAPLDYEIIADTTSAVIAGLRHKTLPHYGVQFHPEVVHTEGGQRIFENFVGKICGCRCDWSPASFMTQKIAEIRELVGMDQVILGLSGGSRFICCCPVDSRGNW